MKTYLDEDGGRAKKTHMNGAWKSPSYLPKSVRSIFLSDAKARCVKVILKKLLIGWAILWGETQGKSQWMGSSGNCSVVKSV